MAVLKRLDIGYWNNFLCLNLAYRSLVYTVVLLHFLGSITCQLRLNSDVSDFADIVEKVAGLYNAANDCEYTCPAGYKRVRNPDHIPSHNGCGAYGIKISLDQFPSITGCCNNHDTCYDTCGSDKALCDGKLKKCVKDICDSIKAASTEQSCRSVAKVIYGGTAVLGCPAFLDAQKKACLCRPKKRDSNKHKEL